MTKLFWGLLFVMLDYTIHIGRCSFSVLPDFIGYILLASACNPLNFESEYFGKAGGISVIAAFITGITFLMGLLGGRSLLLELGELICFVMVCRHIIYGILYTEPNYGRNLGGERLHSLWISSIVMSVAAIVVAFIPLLNLLAIPLMLATLVVNTIFLANIYKCGRTYEELRRTR